MSVRHFNHLKGRPRAVKRCVCLGRILNGKRFCPACLDRLPAEMRENLFTQERHGAGGDQWRAAFATCENWLQANPARRGMR